MFDQKRRQIRQYSHFFIAIENLLVRGRDDEKAFQLFMAAENNVTCDQSPAGRRCDHGDRTENGTIRSSCKFLRKLGISAKVIAIQWFHVGKRRLQIFIGGLG